MIRMRWEIGWRVKGSMSDEREQSESDRNFCVAEKYDGEFGGGNRGIVREPE